MCQEEKKEEKKQLAPGLQMPAVSRQLWQRCPNLRLDFEIFEFRLPFSSSTTGWLRSWLDENGCHFGRNDWRNIVILAAMGSQCATSN